MKNFCKLFGIIVIVTIIGFLAMSCDDASDDNGGGSTGVTVGQLPGFPSGSTPAATRADAETILAELRQSPVLDSIQREIWEVISENSSDSGNFSFSNRSLPNGFVRVNAGATENETYTGGFAIWLDNEEELDNIQFAVGNRWNGTEGENFKGELIRAKTEDGITVAQGSIFESKTNFSWNITVSTAGTYETFRVNRTSPQKYQIIFGFTVTTSSGSVKVILDSNEEYTLTGTNTRLYYFPDNIGTWTDTEKYSGSLKVYGNNNALLIDHRIVDRESSNMAYYMISYDPYANAFNPANAIALTNNVKTDGSISPETVALYSINVTSGTRYHLYWEAIQYDWFEFEDVRVYNSDGIAFFSDRDLGPNSGGDHLSFTAPSTGTVYIMIILGDYYYNSIAFSIVYNTTGNRPAMSVSFTNPLSANYGSMQKAAGVLRHNRRL